MRKSTRKQNEEAGRIAAREKRGDNPRIQNTQEMNTGVGKIAGPEMTVESHLNPDVVPRQFQWKNGNLHVAFSSFHLEEQ